MSATIGARRTELNQNLPHTRKWARLENTGPRFGDGVPISKRGPKTIYFDVSRRLRNLTAILRRISLKANVIGEQHWKLQKGFPQSQNFTNFGPHSRKIGPVFYRSSVNSAFCFIARLRTRKSANATQPNFAACWEASQVWKCTSKIWSPLPYKFGALVLGQFFDTFASCHHIANIFRRKRDVDNQRTELQTT